MQRWGARAVLVLSAVLFALVPAGSALADHSNQGDDKQTGLDRACSHDNGVQNNPHCASDAVTGDGDSDPTNPNGKPKPKPNPGYNETDKPVDRGGATGACVANETDRNDDTGCDRSDTDGDFVPDRWDNCVSRHNPDQLDDDDDGIGDDCDDRAGDEDNDGIGDDADSCPADPNKGTDRDADGKDDACDNDNNNNRIDDDSDLDPVYQETTETVIETLEDTL